MTTLIILPLTSGCRKKNEEDIRTPTEEKGTRGGNTEKDRGGGPARIDSKQTKKCPITEGSGGWTKEKELGRGKKEEGLRIKKGKLEKV